MLWRTCRPAVQIGNSTVTYTVISILSSPNIPPDFALGVFFWLLPFRFINRLVCHLHNMIVLMNNLHRQRGINLCELQVGRIHVHRDRLNTPKLLFRKPGECSICCLSVISL
jgi:hypothetical protein